MKAEEIKKHLAACGWTEDRFGHMKKTTSAGTEVRVKMQATSARLEKKVQFGLGEPEWWKVASAYFKDIEVVDGGLKLGKYVIAAKK